VSVVDAGNRHIPAGYLEERQRAGRGVHRVSCQPAVIAVLKVVGNLNGEQTCGGADGQGFGIARAVLGHSRAPGSLVGSVEDLLGVDSSFSARDDQFLHTKASDADVEHPQCVAWLGEVVLEGLRGRVCHRCCFHCSNGSSHKTPAEFVNKKP